jgi:uncharacterized phage protein (TIGR02218 family)
MKNVTAEFQEKEEYGQRRPAEIYHIWRHNGTTHWYYTSIDSPITFETNIYVPATLERDAVAYNSNLEVSSLNVRAAVITSPATQYLSLNPVETLWIDVRKLFLDQDPYEAVVVFIGQIKAIAFKGGEAQAECVGFEYYLKQQLPIFRYQPQCNNFLFDTKCGLSEVTYEVDATIDSIDSTSTVLTSSAFGGFDDGYFTLGFIKFGDYYRPITEHVGNDVTIRYRLSELSASDSVKAYPGCNLDAVTCRDKFSNVDNFFGHPYIPIKNPVMGL